MPGLFHVFYGVHWCLKEFDSTLMKRGQTLKNVQSPPVQMFLSEDALVEQSESSAYDAECFGFKPRLISKLTALYPEATKAPT